MELKKVRISRNTPELLVAGVAFLLALIAAPWAGAQIPNGTVMVSTGTSEGSTINPGNPRITEFDPYGNYLGQLITVGQSHHTAGSGFDAMGNFFATDWVYTVTKFNPSGGVVGKFGTLLYTPLTVAFDQAGDVYVGDDYLRLAKYSAAGALLATYTLAPDTRDAEFLRSMDLAADQCTLFYTAPGTAVKRFNVCTRQQLADFNVAPLPDDTNAVRLLPSGGLLVADTNAVVRLDASGAAVQSYTLPGASYLFALSLDPNGSSFWTADLFSGEVYQVDIASGTVLEQWTAAGVPYFYAAAGLSVKGEPRVALLANSHDAVRLTDYPNPSSAKSNVSIMAIVVPGPGNSLQPSGTVTFYDGMAALGTVTLGPDSTASLRHTFATSGKHEITAIYSGDTVFVSSQATITQTVH